MTSRPGCLLALSSVLLMATGGAPLAPMTLAEHNALLLRQIEEVHRLTPAQMEQLESIFARAPFLGQGNPEVVRHPMTPDECHAKVEASGRRYRSSEFERICGGPYMAPLYDPTTQTMDQAPACIDQFEFPDIPCAYPVVWVRAHEAAEICHAMGKRLCDAHEWEGACSGALTEPDYRFDLAVGQTPSAAVKRMRDAHNRAHGTNKAWSYGPAYAPGICAAGSRKTPGCEGGGWSACGSNTYPTGAFPECRSGLGVYDLHGNAAEHMSLPLTESQMASRGSRDYGVTEMKGSWFIFDSYRAHEDWCRWRAPYWHGSNVMDAQSHHNYHLGFRCCKTLEAADPSP